MMQLRHATQSDCGLLARINRQLMIAEGSDNPMDEAQLATRMLGFLAGAGICDPEQSFTHARKNGTHTLKDLI